MQDGDTALMKAAHRGHLECVAALIAAGADCEAKKIVRYCRLPYYRFHPANMYRHPSAIRHLVPLPPAPLAAPAAPRRRLCRAAATYAPASRPLPAAQSGEAASLSVRLCVLRLFFPLCAERQRVFLLYGAPWRREGGAAEMEIPNKAP